MLEVKRNSRNSGRENSRDEAVVRPGRNANASRQAEERRADLQHLGKRSVTGTSSGIGTNSIGQVSRQSEILASETALRPTGQQQ